MFDVSQRSLKLSCFNSFFFLLVFFFFFLRKTLFLDRGEGRERNINVWLPLVRPLLETWPATQACALTWGRTGNPLLRRPVLNPLSHTSQGSFCFSDRVFYTTLSSKSLIQFFASSDWLLIPFNVFICDWFFLWFLCS